MYSYRLVHVHVLEVGLVHAGSLGTWYFSAMHRVEINKVYTRGHPVDDKDDGGVTEENHMLHVCIMM